MREMQRNESQPAQQYSLLFGCVKNVMFMGKWLNWFLSLKKALRRAGNVFVEQMSTMQDSPHRFLQQTPKAKPWRGM